jgi:hypothetical protein
MSPSMGKNNYMFGENNLSSTEKFKNTRKNTGDYSLNTCRSWQHQLSK